MDLEIFKNYSGFTDEELAADICCSALSVMLVALVILMKFYTHRVCGTIFKHLTIGLLPFMHCTLGIYLCTATQVLL